MGINQSDSCYLTPVPHEQRRSPTTMGLLWITMTTAFPAVLIGFEWHKQGFSFSQILFCSVLGCIFLLAYAIPASLLGAKSGLGYCGLSRVVFGRWGTRLVAANLIWMSVVWYGIFAVLMAQAVNDLLQVHYSMTVMAIIFGLLMAFNNFFGFAGIANFARFIAAPVLIAWVGYTFFKTINMVPHAALFEPSHQPMMTALTVTSSFVIGFAVWGNEPDYWRYSKPCSLRIAIPMVIALLIGQVIFPITGWLISQTTGITNSDTATAFLNNYSFAGFAIIGLFVLAASYFATNDSILFGSDAALETIWPMKHKTAIIILAMVGAVTAAIFSVNDSIKTLSVITDLSCIFLPVPTVIMITEWWLREKFFRLPIDFANVPALIELPAIDWPAIIALLAGFVVGTVTSGWIPGLESLHVGICSIQAWLTSAFIYTVLRVREYRMETVGQALIPEITEQATESILIEP